MIFGILYILTAIVVAVSTGAKMTFETGDPMEGALFGLTLGAFWPLSFIIYSLSLINRFVVQTFFLEMNDD